MKPPPQFLAHFYCGQTAGCIKIPLRLEVGVSPGDFVFDGDPAPSPIMGQSPQFSAHVYCGQTAASIKMALDMEVDLGPGRPHCGRRGPSSPPPKTGESPQFWAHFWCGQTARCIKMPLDMEVGLSPGDIVLDGDPAAPPGNEQQQPHHCRGFRTRASVPT